MNITAAVAGSQARICFRLMVEIVFLALAAAAPLGNAQTIPGDDANRRLLAEKATRGSSLDFRLYRGYLIVVPGSAGMLTDLHFLVNTGTEHSFADRRLAEKLGTSLRPLRMLVGGQTVSAWKTDLPDLRVGPLMAKSPDVRVLDLSFLEQTLHVRIDVVIGLDVLAQDGFTINYESKKILFGASSVLPVQVPMQSGTPFASVITRVDDVSYRLLVNTGIPSLMLHATTAQPWIQDVKVGQFSLFTNPAGGQVIGKRLAVSSLRVGDLELGRKTAFVVNDENKAFDGSLPIGRLGFKEVAFDFEHHVLGLRR
jgi:predicted aspartyl protease